MLFTRCTYEPGVLSSNQQVLFSPARCADCSRTYVMTRRPTLSAPRQASQAPPATAHAPPSQIINTI